MQSPFEDFADDSTGTVFRDVTLLALIGFVAMVIMLLPHVRKAEDETQDHRAPGNVIVEIHWPSELPYDVDLWVRAPRDVPVGFYNQGSEYFNLLRDDLGDEADATGLNYEITYSRGIPAGEYVVNVHMYGLIPAGTAIPVKVVVSVRKQFDVARQILQTTVNLVRRNQEETAFRFRLDGEGELVEESVTTIRRRLVTVAR